MDHRFACLAKVCSGVARPPHSEVRKSGCESQVAADISGA